MSEQIASFGEIRHQTRSVIVLVCCPHHRPGRMYYFIEYKGLEESFVQEYLDDNLKDKSQIKSFMAAVKGLFDTFNFDMMKAMVEEMNRYDETVSDVIKLINTRPSHSDSTRYAVKISSLGKGLKIKRDRSKMVSGNPISAEHTVYVDLEDESTVGIPLTTNNLRSMDVNAGKFTYSDSTYQVELTRIVEQIGFDYMKEFAA